MCLALVGRVVSASPDGDLARVDVAGVVREINVALLDGGTHAGEYLLIHSGFALERMTPEDARDARAAFEPET